MSVVSIQEGLHPFFPLLSQAQFPFDISCVLKAPKLPGGLWWSEEERLFAVRLNLVLEAFQAHSKWPHEDVSYLFDILRL